jgi:hypothetical protein
MKPSTTDHTGQHWEHLKLVLKLDDVEDEFYWVHMPLSGKHSGSRSLEWVPIIPPPEKLIEGWADTDMQTWQDTDKTEQFKQHPVRAIAGNDDLVLPYSIYLDTTPFTTESFYGVFITNLITGRSHLCAILLKSDMCGCGCRGQCTNFEIQSVLGHFLRAFAFGYHIDRRHDNRPWLPSDAKRARLAGTRLPCYGLCEHIKGDWPELCWTFGFKGHRSDNAPCFCCECNGDTILDFSNCNETDQGWGEEITQEKWEAEVGRCEIKVTIYSSDVLKLLNSRLQFDNRPAGFRGRALFSNFDALGLLKGDRLDPCQSLRDVHALEFETQFPLELIFWRTSVEHRLNRKCILFEMVPGLTYKSLALCSLHILNLGVLSRYIAYVFYFVLLRDVFDLGVSTQDELVTYGIKRLRDLLWDHYKEEHIADPSDNVSRVHNLTEGMLGYPNNKDNPTLHMLRGGEIQSLLTFSIKLLKRFQDKLPAREVGFLIAAGEHILAYFELCRQHGRNLPKGVIGRIFFMLCDTSNALVVLVVLSALSTISGSI